MSNENSSNEEKGNGVLADVIARLFYVIFCPLYMIIAIITMPIHLMYWIITGKSLHEKIDDLYLKIIPKFILNGI